jgi:hypothetical protein
MLESEERPSLLAQMLQKPSPLIGKRTFAV